MTAFLRFTAGTALVATPMFAAQGQPILALCAGALALVLITTTFKGARL